MIVSLVLVPKGFHKEQFTDPKTQPKIKPDLTVHSTGCIHPNKGKLCGQPVAHDKAHGWFCSYHYHLVMEPKRTLTPAISLTPEELILFESRRLGVYISQGGARLVPNGVDPLRVH